MANAKRLSDTEIKDFYARAQEVANGHEWTTTVSRSWAEVVLRALETLVIAEAGLREYQHYTTDQHGCEKCYWDDEQWQAEVRREWGME